jgi:hypothetical protein
MFDNDVACDLTTSCYTLTVRSAKVFLLRIIAAMLATAIIVAAEDILYTFAYYHDCFRPNVGFDRPMSHPPCSELIVSMTWHGLIAFVLFSLIATKLIRVKASAKTPDAPRPG